MALQPDPFARYSAHPQLPAAKPKVPAKAKPKAKKVAPKKVSPKKAGAKAPAPDTAELLAALKNVPSLQGRS